MLSISKIDYKSIYRNKNRKIITIPFDKTVPKGIRNSIKSKYPNKIVVYKLNHSIQRMIRSKNANSDTI